MNKIYAVLSFICFVISSLSISSHLKAQEAIEPEVVYEVFVQSFRDSNGDGIGDLRGLISKLDYIEGLGVTAVWMMPIHPSPSYHKYDVVDYYAIHPDYGTMEDMDMLIAELHRRNMKLILDFVVNHTSSLHPWFIGSATSGDNPYRDYYVWRDFDSVQDEINKKTTTFDSDNITQWHAGNDAKDRYYGFFWNGMPDLNFDNPAVREEIFKIGKYWIDKGVDGFRLDAAKHIYPDDRLDDTRMFWEEFTSRMKALKPDIKIIGEVWADPNILAGLFKGLPSLFNFELTKAIPAVINTGDIGQFMATYHAMTETYTNTNLPFEDAILLSNHDMNRIRSAFEGNIPKTKLAATILMTLPGTVYLYYGEEIGMTGVKPDKYIREPFPWGDDNFKNKKWLEPVHSIPPVVQPLTQQVNDQGSIYHHYKTWIQIRRQFPVLSFGRLEFVSLTNSSLLTYKIMGDHKTYMVIHNTSGDSTTVDIPNRAKIVHGKMNFEGMKLILEPYTSMLLKLED